ncbi:MAG TPA: RNA polymerase sigma-70 factor [Cyclobacteriaceae bacterium]|nr:RNA polymerase sigma-70 factor [Cyclobacteriaceae bacterium]
MNLPEQQHLGKLRSGDIQAYEMIFRTHYEPLCNYAFTFVADRDMAEEIVQGTFLYLWEKREAMEIHSSLKSYLYMAVRNRCLNEIKHRKVRQQHINRELLTADTGTETVSEELAAAELEERIQVAIEKLPEQCRMVFKLSRFEELKYAEIADQLSISVKTVENHMGKALKIMREQLKEYLPLLLLMITNWAL